MLAYYAKDRDEDIGVKEEVHDLYSVLHLVACAIDVVRQRGAIEMVSDLLIYPLAHKPDGEGESALLGHASNALIWALKYMEEKGICYEPLGRHKLEKVV